MSKSKIRVESVSSSGSHILQGVRETVDQFLQDDEEDLARGGAAVAVGDALRGGVEGTQLVEADL
ncbi:hypothetical protein ACU4GR_00330 [Methylobacterium oryzae CBMB20]